MGTNVYILLDRSGSMDNLWNEALGSINGYVKELNGAIRVQVAVFDSNSHDLIRDSLAGDFRPLTNEDAMPRGGTPLNDSALRMMWRILDDNPERAVFVVMTDGYENSSRHANKNDIKALTNKLETKNYEIVYLGANFDKVEDVAQERGVKFEKTMNMGRGLMGQSMRDLAQDTMVYASATSADFASGNYEASGAFNFDASRKARAEGKTDKT